MSRCPVRSSWLAAVQCVLAVLLVHFSGCSSSNGENSRSAGERDRSAKPAPIRVVVVDDEPLGETIERRWKAASGGEILVENVAESSAASVVSKTASADVLIYPSAWLGELAESKQLIPVSSRVLHDSQYDRLDMLPLDRTAAVTWGEKIYAFSFGSPQLVLMYRKDVFERLNLAAPATWEEYQQTIERLSAEICEDQSRQAAIEPLATGWASQMLLARAAAYARQRSRYWTLFNYATMRPMIDSPPFRRALEELVTAARVQDGTTALTPEQVRKRLLAGRALMAITWPIARNGVSADNSVDIGFAPLPGSRQAYNFSENAWKDLGDDRISRVTLFGFDGRLGSVLATSAHPRDAFNFLAWLTGGERSQAISATSSHTAPFRQRHKSQARLWIGDSASAESAEAYFTIVEASKREPLTMGALRIPGREQYFAILDRAVRQALSGADPGVVLATAAAQWRAITESYGLEKQRTAYKRSLGIEP